MNNTEEKHILENNANTQNRQGILGIIDNKSFIKEVFSSDLVNAKTLLEYPFQNPQSKISVPSDRHNNNNSH